ncbi:MAG: PilZ domain-containing protein [Bdellovibrionaceae bacterium]|nr:PilZ domain-containing protein [Pseudobdellovibrionaceae bacterium]
MGETLYNDNGFLRRRFPRRALSAQVGVLHRGHYFIARSHEIGEGGMALVLDSPLAQGDLVVVSVQIPSGDFVSLRGEIRSTQRDPDSGNYIQGVAFTNIKFSHKRQIRAYVASRSEKERLLS